MASKSYGWEVRNIVKINPKMVKKGHFSTSEGKRAKPTPLPHMRLWFVFGDFFQISFHKKIPNSPILLYFEVLLLFLSLKYDADFGRSRLVVKDYQSEVNDYSDFIY